MEIITFDLRSVQNTSMHFVGRMKKNLKLNLAVHKEITGLYRGRSVIFRDLLFFSNIRSMKQVFEVHVSYLLP